MAEALAKRKVISDASVVRADTEALEKMGTAFGHPPEVVPVHLGGL
jgi:hypothetical protein